MRPVLTSEVIDLSNYAFRALRAGEFVLYRGAANGLASILLLEPREEPATTKLLSRLECEYALRDKLDAAWAARPIAVVPHGGRMALVLEDPGGDPLERLIGSPWAIGRFLRIAVALTVSLRRMHAVEVVHKDIKPAHVLVNEESGGVWLTGFGIATRISREKQTLEPPAVIAGTLAYMAPEQTGRMNRSIDSRADLYALGITFYEMLTGVRPFEATDPVEWMHCHIARQPMELTKRSAAIPAPLATIVMKLLLKTADDRYQTAGGLQADLERCLAAWETFGRIDPFLMGTNDGPDRLMIPERLYGREREIETLLAVFDSVVATGVPELVTVSGYSGIGKSSVVHELYKAIALSSGLFAYGKFDARLRDVPYVTLVQGFQGLIRQLLKESAGEISRWGEAIRKAVGSNCQLLIDLLPELESLIGQQPPVAVLSEIETQLRFRSVFQKFVGVFARAEHPLVLFIDDLQWLDSGTLALIEHVMTDKDTRHLLLIGAYRDNEVGASHPLTRTLDSVRDSAARVKRITLKPLSRADVARLLCDSLRCTASVTQPLANLVLRKTGGNPFFVNQFLSSLAEEGLLEIDPQSRTFRWDVERISTQGFTDNLIDLMLRRIQRLSSGSQRALALLSCLGNHVAFATLAMIREESSGDLNAGIHEAVRAGLVVTQSGGYRFLHDRIQEAAYELFSQTTRAEHHLRVGRTMFEAMTQQEIAENIFDIVNQYNLGAALIGKWKERELLATLNLQAGRKAKASTAYSSACLYFHLGMQILADDGWQRCYSIALPLWLERAECELLSSNFEESIPLIEEVLRQARSKRDKAEAYRWRIVLRVLQGDLAAAVATADECLAMFGLSLTARPTLQEVRLEYDALWDTLGERSIESLIDLPLMDDPEMLAVIRILSTLTIPTYLTDHNCCQIILCRTITLALRHGICEPATMCFYTLGTFLGPVYDRYRDGERLCQLGVEIAQKHGYAAQKAGALFALQMAGVWTRPLYMALASLDAAIAAAKQTGEIVFQCCSREHRLTDRLARGDLLEQIWRESMDTLEFVKRTKFQSVVHTILSIQHLVHALRGAVCQAHPSDRAALEGELIQGGNSVVRFFYEVLQMQQEFLLGDPQSVLELAARARPHLLAARLHIQAVDYYVYHSLAIAAQARRDSTSYSSAMQTDLSSHLETLHRLAQCCPSTFSHKYALVAAEVAGLEGRTIEALQLYDEAIREAARNGFIPYQALANELAARFHARNGLERMADLCLREARHCYLQWGALGKVAQLDQGQPELALGTETDSALTIEQSIAQSIATLDLASVTKMSQAVSAEIIVESLIKRLMMIAVEHAGAYRGVLVFARGEELFIGAEATSDSESVVVRLIDKPISRSELPELVLHYVLRTREALLLDDACTEGPFGADEYFLLKRTRSVLCLPLLRQGTSIGLLYLENPFASHVFTPSRIAVLKLLSSQAAISLENARLFTDVLQENRERQRAEAALRRSEASLVEAQAISHTGNWRWRVGRTEIFVSMELRRIYAWDPALPVSTVSVKERIHPDDLPSFRQVLRRATRKKNRFEHEHAILLPDGSLRYVLMVGQPDLESSDLEYVGTIMDITERRRAEDIAQNAQADLAHMARLTMMGELVASIAHEISQPLMAIASNGNACRRWLNRAEPDLTEALDSVSSIVLDADRAGDVVRGLRALAKKSGPQFAQFNLDDAIREVLVLTRSELNRHGVVLYTALGADFHLTLGDRVQLQQVLLNLILNGLDAMSTVTDRPKTLSITSKVEQPGVVAVTVEDAGTGLDPAMAERIFEAFFSTKRDGMGMGLSICRTIIKAHGGRIWAQPRSPAGTTFKFTVPQGLTAGV